MSEQRGQSSAEYLGLVVVVALIIAALLASAPGVGESVRSGIGCAIESIGGGGGGCGAAPGTGGPGTGGPPGAPAPPSSVDAPEQDKDEDEDEGNFLTGAWEGAKDLAGEAKDTVVGIGRHVNVFDLEATGEQWQRTFETAEQVMTHPWESTKAIASSFWDPIAESYEHGGLDEALGRGLVTGAGAVVGGKGLTKIGTLGRAERVADAAPDRPRTPDADARRERAERANCVSNSFTAGTQVLMASGERRAIARVAVGDRVVATDPETGTTGARAVERVIVGEGQKTLVRVRASGEVISATDRHPFWVESRRAWVDAKDLRAGDRLRHAGGGLTEVDAVKVLDPRPKRVYNLTVSGLHTYYAGRQPVLVHNCAKRSTNADPTARRVTLRKSTEEAIKKAARKTPAGDYIDPNTGKIVPKEGPFDYGHRPGFEWRTTQERARREGWTRDRVIEHENDPSHYQIEDLSSNRSHEYEKKPRERGR